MKIKNVRLTLFRAYSEKRIVDKDLEIKLLTSKYNNCIGDQKELGKKYNSVIEDYNKLVIDNEVLKTKNNTIIESLSL